ncbi:MAG: hypothetical protein IT371_19125 [Deltaproteobacteria bacterium]|nr:hypothetical protein [Deltaproteobacteria bacterium]
MWAEDFLNRFAGPLVAGGEVHVGEPLDAEDLEALVRAPIDGTEGAARLDAARQQIVGQLWLYPLDTALDELDWKLLVGIHNTLFLSHPSVRTWRASSSGVARVERFTAACLGPPPVEREEEAVLRHSLVRGVIELVRTDVKIHFWAGTRSFEGAEPPARLLRWREVRQVEERRTTVRWLESALSPVQHRLLSLLLSASPLTALVTPLRPAPPFRWMDGVRLLRGRRLARLVAHTYLALGLPEVEATLAADFWELVHRAASARGREASELPPEGALRLLVGLIQYLFACVCLAGDPPSVDAATEPARALSSVAVAGQRCGLTPPELGGSAAGRRYREWVGKCDRAFGEAAGQLAADLGAALEAMR